MVPLSADLPPSPPPPSHQLIYRHYPLVLPLPHYLSALLPDLPIPAPLVHLSTPSSSSSAPSLPPPPPNFFTDQPSHHQDSIQKLNGTLVAVQDLSLARALLRSQPPDRLHPQTNQTPSPWQSWSDSHHRPRTSPLESDPYLSLETLRQVVRSCQLQLLHQRSRSPRNARHNNLLTLGYSLPDERQENFNFLPPPPPPPALPGSSLGSIEPIDLGHHLLIPPPHTNAAFPPSKWGKGGALINHFPNTLVTSLLTSKEWRLLLVAFGENVLRHLLVQTTIFLPVSSDGGRNGCFVQMNGRPLFELTPLGKGERLMTSYDPAQVEDLDGRGKGRKEGDQGDEDGKDCRKRKTRTRRSRTSKAQINKLKNAPDLCSNRPGPTATNQTITTTTTEPPKRLNEMVLVRSRIFYARPIRSKDGKVSVGLPLIHIFNRTSGGLELSKILRGKTRPLASASEDRQVAGQKPRNKFTTTPLEYPGDPRPDQTTDSRRVRHILKYIWPRQFKLHNAFTCPTDSNSTTHPFQDYTIRENEIRALGPIKTPNRLRPVLRLVRNMLRRHDRFNYRKALDICCPSRLPKRRLTRSDREKIAEDLSERLGESTLSASMTNHDSSLSDPSSTSQERWEKAPLTQDLDESSETVTTTKSTQPTKATTTTTTTTTLRTKEREKPRFANYMVTTGQVIRYVRMVLKAIVPRELVGSQANLDLLLRRASDLVKCRRYESVTVHQLMQGIKVNELDWVYAPSHSRCGNPRSNAVEWTKRVEMVQDLIYYLFDSIILPLLRTSFYCTESSAFRNRVLYFRQDDWLAVSGPILERMKDNLFSPVKRQEALGIMSERKLGYSHIRLLPKEVGVRPIVNLRRRSTKQQQNHPQQQNPSSSAANPCGNGERSSSIKKGKRRSDPSGGGGANLGRSINYILQSAFNILTFEKENQPRMLGSSVFGTNEIHQKLKRFKLRCQLGRWWRGTGQDHLRKPPRREDGQRKPRVDRHGADVEAGKKKAGRSDRDKRRKLYFVKVDVRCAFDSIEQEKLLSIIRQILSQKRGYQIQRYARLNPSGEANSKVTRTFVRRALPDSISSETFVDLAQGLAKVLRNVIFVDHVVYQYEERARVLKLLEQHVTCNLVKIGRDFYRQKVGIPQGSSISTLLCSFFYGDMERRGLGFLGLDQDDRDPTSGRGGYVKPSSDKAEGEMVKMTSRLGEEMSDWTTEKTGGKGSRPSKARGGDGGESSISRVDPKVGSESLLLRYTDDFLFITQSKSKAKSFWRRMRQGFPEYGCQISIEKSLVNFDLVDESGLESGGSTVGGEVFVPRCKSPTSFAWCGLLIDTRDLSVKADMERYRGNHIADSLTVQRSRRPRSNFNEKLLKTIKNRCQTIFTDPQLNSEKVVIENLHQAFLVSALKAMAYVRSLGEEDLESFQGHGKDGGGAGRFLLESVKRLSSYAYGSILRVGLARNAKLQGPAHLSFGTRGGRRRRRTSGLGIQNPKGKPYHDVRPGRVGKGKTTWLKRKEVETICLLAFHQVLESKLSRRGPKTKRSSNHLLSQTESDPLRSLNQLVRIEIQKFKTLDDPPPSSSPEDADSLSRIEARRLRSLERVCHQSWEVCLPLVQSVRV